MAGLAASFGSGAMTNPISDIEKADVILVTGSNTTETHPVISAAIKRAAKFGGKKLIVADPREITLKKHAHLKMAPRPGGDIAWINGMIHVILEEGLQDKRYILERTEGFDAMAKSVAPFTPGYVRKITGIPEETLIAAARLYAGAEKGSILYCMGITQHINGTDAVKALANLAMVCGNVGIEGGGVNPLRGQNNVQGACDMGGLPDVYPGYRKVHEEAHAQTMEKAWGVTGLSRTPGLTATDMVDAAINGKLKALYVIGENPLVSEADLNHTEKGFSSLEFLVVQDIFMSETARAADVVLPALCFAEKEGTFTNTERRVQRVRKAVDGPDGVSTDWEIVCDIARRMGTDMGFTSAEAIFTELAAVTPSFSGLSYPRIEDEGIPWPCPTADHPGTPRLHVGTFAKGKGTFHAIAWTPPAEVTDEDYPLALTTGRVLYHYHTGTMTRKSKGLNERSPECFVEMEGSDAKALGLADGTMATVTSRRGEITARVKVSRRMGKGTVFIPFHFAEAAANRLTNAKLDPVSKIPEFKVCAVRIASAPDAGKEN
ncbi:formate dehydrogenase major subunit/formate dehydrogenase alpha subunit [Desulfoluna spongiiphila]|uniref:nitrate reductase (cytochrome) n=1 Tax=Desulfoluna spongiiphila TaxID=419481 RepID=A0A1G5E398_9BACT|nr:formate dehydrogenase major subunit/formate dehydrogenase alpha subunit [Desulfoluna spongiiphila]